MTTLALFVVLACMEASFATFGVLWEEAVRRRGPTGRLALAGFVHATLMWSFRGAVCVLAAAWLAEKFTVA